MAIQKIQPSDKLNSGFRGKYNETIDRIWVSIEDRGDGTVRVTAFDGAVLDVSLKTSFYTKTELAGILEGINSATDEREGIIRIATAAEAREGSSPNTAITPETLHDVLAREGVDAIVSPADPDPLLADINTLYFQQTANGMKIHVAKLVGEAFVWILSGEILFSVGTTVVPDSDIYYGMTGAQLDIKYPSLKTGDIVVNKDATPQFEFMKYGPGEWAYRSTELV